MEVEAVIGGSAVTALLLRSDAGSDGTISRHAKQSPAGAGGRMSAPQRVQRAAGGWAESIMPTF
jgi:hypothetical protein